MEKKKIYFFAHIVLNLINEHILLHGAKNVQLLIKGWFSLSGSLYLKKKASGRSRGRGRDHVILLDTDSITFL